MKHTKEYVERAIEYATEQTTEGNAKYWFTLEVLKEIQKCIELDEEEAKK